MHWNQNCRKCHEMDKSIIVSLARLLAATAFTNITRTAISLVHNRFITFTYKGTATRDIYHFKLNVCTKYNSCLLASLGLLHHFAK